MAITISAEARTARWLRLGLLAVIGANLALICFRVLLYVPVLSQRGGILFVLAPVVLLLVYAGVTLAITADPSPSRNVALRAGLAVGLLTGAMWVVDLAIETFAALSWPASLLATAPLLLGAFALWGAAAGYGAWRTGSIGSGVLTSVWAAMICVLLTITFGFLLTYTSMTTLQHDLVSDPDFLRSHWSDLRAFAITNTFGSGFSHLLGAPIVGTVVGVLGSIAGLLLGGRRMNRRTPR